MKCRLQAHYRQQQSCPPGPPRHTPTVRLDSQARRHRRKDLFTSTQVHRARPSHQTPKHSTNPSVLQATIHVAITLLVASWPLGCSVQKKPHGESGQRRDFPRGMKIAGCKCCGGLKFRVIYRCRSRKINLAGAGWLKLVLTASWRHSCGCL